MCMYDRRLQILLDDDRYERIAEAARDRGVSVAAVIRDAIDRGVPVSRARRRSAGEAILAARGGPVPDVDDLRAELADMHNRHA